MEMKTLQAAGHSIALFYADEGGAQPLIVMLDGAETGEKVRRFAPDGYALACVKSDDWDRDFSPWPAPRAFRGGKDFSGGARSFLDLLISDMLPAVQAALPFPASWRGLAGYSLAGLFALYALYETNAFSRIASVSGSLWYDGFCDFALSHEIKAKPELMYLSLGEREASTQNARLSTVLTRTRILAAHYTEQFPTFFELNAGGHFDRPDERLAQAVRYLTMGERTRRE